jgi:hypothetical protein
MGGSWCEIALGVTYPIGSVKMGAEGWILTSSSR